MKPYRLLFMFVLLFSVTTAFTQNATLIVSGHVIDQLSQNPIANHVVSVKIFPDSSANNFLFSGTAITDQSGSYMLPFEVTFTPGTALPIYVSTTDCMMMYIEQIVFFTGNQTAFTADFSICNDSIFPPSPCENFIMPTGVQGLTASFEGSVVNSQTASYFWELGDGTSSTGSTVTHTYNQQGLYNITLQTITSDSCVDYSNYTLILMDTIYPPSQCENFINILGLQNLNVSFEGSMVLGQPADYSWNFGDGTSGSGKFIDHTYSQFGTYMVELQTITNDSCISLSSFPLILMDSIPNGCSSYFSAGPTGIQREINFSAFSQSVYPTEFTWDLGDGTTATGQNFVHTYCCFGTYTVVLTASDSLGCFSTFVAPVNVMPDSINGSLNINGQVKAGNIWLNQGTVSLFATDPAGYYYLVQSTYIDSAGSYSFWNINEGNYIVLAYPQPDSLSQIQYLPTYYGNVIFWEQATPITLGIPQNPYNINLVSIDTIGGGDGTITGQINGGGKSTLTAGQEVLLLDAFGVPVRITYTDGQGNFTFTNLPFGEYTVNPVLTGITTNTAPLTLNAANISANVIMTLNGHTITGISEFEQSQIQNIYPNPAVDQLYVTLNSPGTLRIQIIDASGKTILTRNEVASQAGALVSIPVTALKPGLYLFNIQNEKGNTSSGRFIKN